MAHPELEYFLLAVVVDHHLPLSLLEEDCLGEVVNRFVPRFTREELLDTLSDLFRCGDLAAKTAPIRLPVSEAPGICSRHIGSNPEKSYPSQLNRHEIDGALCGVMNFHYGLTPQGGARWEAMAEYDWRYHIGDLFNDGFESPFLELNDVYPEYPSCAMKQTEQWETSRPWQPTYWKSFSEDIRVRYQDPPFQIRFPGDQPSWEISGLWMDAWNERAHRNMRKFIPMSPVRSEITDRTAWRVHYRSMSQQSIGDLLLSLEAADLQVQFDAGMRLATLDDPPVAELIDWFRRTPASFTLRVLSCLHNIQVLDALVDFLKARTFCRCYTIPYYLALAIGQFGDLALPPLISLLHTGVFQTQMEVLGALGETGSFHAGTVILAWLHTLAVDHKTWREELVKKALLALARLVHTPALQVFEEFLMGRNGRAGCNSAIEALASFDQVDARNLLRKFAGSDAGIRGRLYAMNRLASTDPSLRRECERLEREAHLDSFPDETARYLGDDCKAHVSDTISALVVALRDSAPTRRLQAITLLGRNPGVFPADEIARMFDDPVPAIRGNAAYSFGFCGRPSDISRIRPLLNDPSGLVRYCAQDALIRLKGSAIPVQSEKRT